MNTVEQKTNIVTLAVGLFIPDAKVVWYSMARAHKPT
jgi:hypothetical protein